MNTTFDRDLIAVFLVIIAIIIIVYAAGIYPSRRVSWQSYVPTSSYSQTYSQPAAAYQPFQNSTTTYTQVPTTTTYYQYTEPQTTTTYTVNGIPQ